MIFLAVFVLSGTGLMAVQGALGDSSVICTDTTMTVGVRKAAFTGVHEDHLQLNMVTSKVCRLRSNSTHIFCVIPLRECGTVMTETEDSIIFKNEITMADESESVITRKHELEAQFFCEYHKKGNVCLSYTANRNRYTVVEKGFGTFSYQFLFFQSDTFQNMIDPKTYPLDIDVGTVIYMQIEATSSVPDTELFVESCRAAPNNQPNFRPSYAIMEDGCKRDLTFFRYNINNKKKFRFRINAFKFIGLYDEVYICCSVMMCKTGESNTRCAKGCISGHHVSKRDVAGQSQQHFVSQGPLRLRRSAERPESPVVNLNLNLVFIAGCLLAAVGMISAVVMYKTRISKTRYQRLAESES